MFNSVLPLLVGKEVALFGSYGWGDGEWMNRWVETCVSNGITPIQTIIANYTADETIIEELKQLGIKLVS